MVMSSVEVFNLSHVVYSNQLVDLQYSYLMDEYRFLLSGIILWDEDLFVHHQN
jgi:hypothetical protein